MIVERQEEKEEEQDTVEPLLNDSDNLKSKDSLSVESHIHSKLAIISMKSNDNRLRSSEADKPCGPPSKLKEYCLVFGFVVIACVLMAFLMHPMPKTG